MLAAFELLREAGIHLPGPIGQTIGIVGGLIVGQAAVEASLVSPLMIIVIAFTGISSFAIPNYGLAIALRILTFPLMILAAVFGLFGLVFRLVPHRQPSGCSEEFWRAHHFTFYTAEGEGTEGHYLQAQHAGHALAA